jgi:phenylalanine-4-hydroxylase
LIPGNVFFELLANGILPIATEIRKITNIAYTPAPDIIHEAAGHAPILFDPVFREFVQKIGAIGAKAFATKEKQELFDAVRNLTIVMEDPISTEEEKIAAQRLVEEKQNAIVGISEAEKISRMFWRTVEYGLIGEVDDPKIYGAGLLSSVGESTHCFTDAVEKIPFSVEACTVHPKNVTEMQSQLFVCKSFEELIEGAESVANTMAFRVGGTESLEKALLSKSVATFELNSGLSVTGIVHSILKDSNEEAIYVNTSGETALSINNRGLKGHGKTYHRKGFGTPIGALKGNIELENCNHQMLKELGIIEGEKVVLEFLSNITVSGRVVNLLKNEDNVALISFEDCTVTHERKELFKKEWGTFDMAVGSKVESAYPGATDPIAFYDEEIIQDELTNKVPAQLTELEKLYQQVRDIRENGILNDESIQQLIEIHQELNQSHSKDWLLRLELLEISVNNTGLDVLLPQLRTELEELRKEDSVRELIKNGLKLV